MADSIITATGPLSGRISWSSSHATTTPVGISDEQISGGTVEAGGGFCTFTTTFAISDTRR